MFSFLLFGRGRGQRPNSKKHKRPRPFRACLCFCCLGGWPCLFFAVWVGCIIFLAVWARVKGGCVFFCCLGGCVSCFVLFGRGACSFCCCLGGGRVSFFAVWAGDGSSLTCRSAWLVFRRPNNKKDQTAKKNTGS